MKIKHSKRDKWSQVLIKGLLIGVIYRIWHEEIFIRFKEANKQEWTQSHLNYIEQMKNFKL